MFWLKPSQLMWNWATFGRTTILNTPTKPSKRSCVCRTWTCLDIAIYTAKIAIALSVNIQQESREVLAYSKRGANTHAHTHTRPLNKYSDLLSFPAHASQSCPQMFELEEMKIPRQCPRQVQNRIGWTTAAMQPPFLQQRLMTAPTSECSAVDMKMTCRCCDWERKREREREKWCSALFTREHQC